MCVSWARADRGAFGRGRTGEGWAKRPAGPAGGKREVLLAVSVPLGLPETRGGRTLGQVGRRWRDGGRKTVLLK